MADRYTEDEVADQVAQVHALIVEGLSHQAIATKLGISKSTVHQRRYSRDLADRRRDEGTAGKIRHQATRELHGWLSRIDEAYDEGQVGVLDAAREAARIWQVIVRLWGANLPIEVRVRPTLASTSGDSGALLGALLAERQAIEAGRKARMAALDRTSAGS